MSLHPKNPGAAIGQYASATSLTMRSDNGPEFIARALKIWLLQNQSDSATIEPARPWQNGSVESFHATLRHECLDAEYFAHPREAKILIEQWRWEDNCRRPHSSLGYKTPDMVGRETREEQLEAQPINRAILSWLLVRRMGALQHNERRQGTSEAAQP